MKKLMMGLVAVLLISHAAYAEEGGAPAGELNFQSDHAAEYVAGLASRVKINGFLSQGFLQSSGNNFLGDSKNGTFEFNEVGLTFNAEATPKLRLGVQLLSRDLGDVSNNEVRLDWASADYRASDLLGIRIGKVKLPMGFYNQSRDSDFLRSMVFLPQSIYDETKRELLVSYQGGGIYGNIPLKALGDLEYQGFLGEISFPNDATLLSQLKSSAQQVLASNPGVRPAVQGYPTPPSFITFFRMENKYIGGGALVYNTPMAGLRLGASFLTVNNDIYINSTTPNGELKMKSKFVYSAEYTFRNFVLAGEYAETDRRQVLLNNTMVTGPSQEYYVMAAYTMFDRLTLSLLYDIYYDIMSDKDGLRYKGKPNSYDFQGWRKDMGVGLRYDVNQFWTLKAEYHDVNGAALFTNVFNPSPVPGGRPALRKEWNYFAFKASFNF